MLNNMTNIAELLKDAPEGMKLYSPLFGEVEFMEIGSDGFLRVHDKELGGVRSFDFYGRYFYETFPDAECLLFPSKDCRVWKGWKAPKPHYDIANFQPFDKVLVRDYNTNKWSNTYFGFYDEKHKAFVCDCCEWNQCIPYEGNEHLLGTTDPCGEEYINW